MGNGTAMVKFRSEKLTTCRVAADGGEVGLEFLDSSGRAVRLEMPVEQAESLIMTLPQLLACALPAEPAIKMLATSSGSASGRSRAPKIKPA